MSIMGEFAIFWLWGQIYATTMGIAGGGGWSCYQSKISTGPLKMTNSPTAWGYRPTKKIYPSCCSQSSSSTGERGAGTRPEKWRGEEGDWSKIVPRIAQNPGSTPTLSPKNNNRQHPYSKNKKNIRGISETFKANLLRSSKEAHKHFSSSIMLFLILKSENLASHEKEMKKRLVKVKRDNKSGFISR